MSQRFAYWLKVAFFAAITLLSASTSFGYFLEVFQLTSNWIASLASGLVGVLVTDGAVFAWLKIYLDASDNNDERAFAAIGAFIGGTGSVIASFAFLLSTTPLVEFPPALASWSTIAIAVIVVIHFLLVVLSGYRSTQAQTDEKMAELLAEANQEMLTQTEDEFRKRIPALASQNADRLLLKLASRFSLLADHQTIENQAKKQ